MLWLSLFVRPAHSPWLSPREWLTSLTWVSPFHQVHLIFLGFAPNLRCAIHKWFSLARVCTVAVSLTGACFTALDDVV